MKKSIVIAIAVVLVLTAIMGRMLVRQQSAKPPIARARNQSIPTSPANRVGTTPPPPVPEKSVQPKASSSPEVVPSRAEPPQSVQATQPPRQASSPQEPIQDPVARVALAFVGSDPDAEQYWLEAINDPSLSADERQNLIEDLNEDGLSDPKNPGPEDLPVILSRLALIEEVGPYAMDKVNYDAFAEAYKDLINLAKRTQGGGEPVK